VPSRTKLPQVMNEHLHAPRDIVMGQQIPDAQLAGRGRRRRAQIVPRPDPVHLRGNLGSLRPEQAAGRKPAPQWHESGQSLVTQRGPSAHGSELPAARAHWALPNSSSPHPHTRGGNRTRTPHSEMSFVQRGAFRRPTQCTGTQTPLQLTENNGGRQLPAEQSRWRLDPLPADMKRLDT
jgi:hypothetical protein